MNKALFNFASGLAKLSEKSHEKQFAKALVDSGLKLPDFLTTPQE